MKRRFELWSLVCAAFAVGWIAAPLAQGAAQAPTVAGTAGQGQLADRRRRSAEERLAAQRDAHHQGERQEHEARLEAAARQPAAPDAQPLSAAHRQRRDDRRRAEGDRDRRGDLRQPLRHRRRQGHAALEAQVRQHVRRTDRRPRARRAVSGRLDGNSGDRPGRRRRQVHRLRHLVGRPAAQAGRRHGRRDRARGTVPAAQRQAVRAEPARQRALHDHRPGLRRQSERVLFLRSRDQEGRPVPARQRRHVAALGRDARQGRHALRRVWRRRLLPRAADLRAEHHRRRSRTPRPRRWS